MNLALTLAVPAVSFGALACSAPPNPPPQAAITIAVQPDPSSGESCDGSHSYLSIPQQSIQNEVNQELLNCDESTGCKPDENVVVDRSQGIRVTCSVAPSGDEFEVSASVSSSDLTLSVTGTVSASGSSTGLTMNSYDSQTQKSRTSNSCTLTITPNKGGIKKGEIWATFHCDAFNVASQTGASDCLTDGAFLFENCSG